MGREALIAHLGFIQNVISRMGSNSFLIKGWVITLVAASFALASKDANKSFMYLVLFPIIFFWWLDAFYLRQEKLYRILYSEVCKDQSLSDCFCMDAKRYSDKVGSVLNVAFSGTLRLFYGCMVFVVVIFLLFFYCKGRCFVC